MEDKVADKYLKRKKIAEIIWIIICAIIILSGIFIDLALSFIAAIFFMGISYFASGINSYQWKPNPYKSMAKSPQPDEIEYKSIRKEEERIIYERKNEFSWIIIIFGLLPLFIDFILLIISYRG